MTINDQIRDEKLQYDINREAAKISALSSGKIHKYEYLTGEEILLSKQQIIEQAKFTYSPLGKTFEKQIKAIEDRGQEQIEALKRKAMNDKSKNNPPISKELFNKILEERMNEILKMSREINYNNLVYNFKDSCISPISFAKFGGPLYTYDQLKKGDKTLQQVEEQKKLNQN